MKSFLLPLVQFLHKRLPEKIEILDKKVVLLEETHHSKFYDALLNDEFFNSNSDAFRKNEERLFLKILHLLPLISFGEEVSERARVISFLEKLSYAASICRLINAQTTLKKISQLGYDKAEQFQLPRYKLIFLEYLVNYYSFKGDSKKIESLEQKAVYLLEAYQAEVLSTISYNKIVSLYVNSLSSKKENICLLEKTILEIENYYTKYPFINIYQNLMELKKIYSAVTHNSTEKERICHDTIAFYQQHSHLAKPTTLSNAYRDLMLAYFEQKNYQRALEMVPIIESIFVNRSTTSWFDFQFSYIRVLLRAKKYKEALAVYRNAISNEHLDRQHNHVLEKWYVIEPFMRLLNTIYPLESFPQTSAYLIFIRNKEKEFISSYYHFTNSLPKFRNDETGYAIQLTIGHILTLLALNKKETVIDAIEAFSKMIYRKRKKIEYYRMVYFAGMLKKIVTSDFDIVETQIKAQKYIDKLREIPVEADISHQYIEIVEFEELWYIILAIVGVHQHIDKKIQFIMKQKSQNKKHKYKEIQKLNVLRSEKIKSVLAIEWSDSYKEMANIIFGDVEYK